MREFPPRFLSFCAVAVSGSDKIRSLHPRSWIRSLAKTRETTRRPARSPWPPCSRIYSQKERSFVTRLAAFLTIQVVGCQRPERAEVRIAESLPG